MKNISTALLNFHKEIGKITKDSDNPFFKSKYASLSNILSAIKEPLQSSNLVITQIPTGDNELKTVIYHTESGESIEGTAKMLIAKQDIQGQGSALTYMRRYALGSMLGLNIDDDDDGNASIGRSQATVATKKTYTAPPAKPYIKEHEFVEAIGKMLANETIKVGTPVQTVVDFLELKYQISMAYRNRIESEINKQALNIK